VTDKVNGRRRRFGYIEMSSNAEARAAIGRLNLTQHEDTVMSVSFARTDQQGDAVAAARGEREIVRHDQRVDNIYGRPAEHLILKILLPL